MSTGMILKTNIGVVRDNPALFTFIQLHVLTGLKSECTEKITSLEYDFKKDDREDTVSFADMTMLLGIASGLWIRNAEIYTNIVEESKLTQIVPVEFPNSTITEGEEGSEITRQRTWQEYTTVHPVIGGYILRYCNGLKGTYPDDWGYRELTDSCLRLWRDNFGFSVKRRGKELIAEYQASLLN